MKIERGVVTKFHEMREGFILIKLNKYSYYVYNLDNNTKNLYILLLLIEGFF
jgi:hypothetical protein